MEIGCFFSLFCSLLASRKNEIGKICIPSPSLNLNLNHNRGLQLCRYRRVVNND